jgi:alkanesulfonate monooxygenase SsuD/methylene tetrahydromethanopterin reductase-like flavin-dependent oxidoreductase (luciferase family)
MKIAGHMTCERFDEYIKSAQLMENAGYARLWVVDSQMLWEDGYVYGAYALEKTTRIQWGTAVSNPITRHYSVSASAAATLASIYPGRVILGMGRGDSAVRTLGFRPLSTQKIEPVLQKTKKLLAGEEVQEGESKIVLRWLKNESRVPLMYSATGPANLKIGGRIADIVMLQVGTHPAAVEWAISKVHEGAREAGRNPKEVEIALLCGLWISENRKESRDACRWAASCATNHLEDVAKAGHADDLPKVLRDVLAKKRAHYDYYAGHLDSQADHSEYLTDEMIDNFSINGVADDCLKKIKMLKDLGVGELSTAYLNGHYQQIERVGKQIIPFV